MDDEAVIGRVLAGDVEAFDALVERYQRPVFAVVGSHVRDASRVEDLAQDVFLSAFTKLASWRAERGRFSTWLYSIARNRSRDALRKRAEIPLAEPPERAVADAYTGEGGGSRLDAALAALPEERRVAFLLAEVHGLPHETVASVEGVAIGTIKSRVSRAKAALRAALQAEIERDV